MLPAIFVSHGSPTLALDSCPARDFLKHLGGSMHRPQAILVVSAHWETRSPKVNRISVNETIHDFSGFPEPLYRMRYPAPGSVQLADRTRQLLAGAGIASGTDDARGLDHGAWVPLMLAYPKADVPVVQLSLQPELGPQHHLKLGQALAPLRAEGVLVLGTGSLVHNLRTLSRAGINAPEPAWVTAFADWIGTALEDGRTADLLDYRGKAPNAAMAHPTEEHFLPLFVALGAGGDGARAKRLHKSTTFGTLRMDAYGFA